MISVTKLYWSQKWSITNWIGSMLHFGAVWTSSLSIAEVNKYEKRLEPFETEANKQEWGLGFSSQTLLGNRSCTMFNVFEQLVPVFFRHCSYYTRELSESVWKAIQQAECENGLRPWLTVIGDHIIGHWLFLLNLECNSNHTSMVWLIFLLVV